VIGSGGWSAAVRLLPLGEFGFDFRLVALGGPDKLGGPARVDVLQVARRRPEGFGAPAEFPQVDVIPAANPRLAGPGHQAAAG
jgi:hypothetical protein